jgi:hypothetical protein
MAMNDARRPTTASSASTRIHFFSICEGFSEAVVLVCIVERAYRGLESEGRAGNGAGAACQHESWGAAK